MNNPKISFSRNWNEKLCCKIFPTVRKRTDDKLDFYGENLGKLFDVFLEQRKIFSAFLIAMKSFRLRDVPLEFLFLDTGCDNRDAVFAIFENYGIQPDDEVLLLFFKKKAW
jgi:hypothetical protein